MRFVIPGYPMQSLFLQNPLHPDGGGTPMHGGCIRWESQDDPEWQELAAWVGGGEQGQHVPHTPAVLKTVGDLCTKPRLYKTLSLLSPNLDGLCTAAGNKSP